MNVRQPRFLGAIFDFWAPIGANGVSNVVHIDQQALTIELDRLIEAERERLISEFGGRIEELHRELTSARDYVQAAARRGFNVRALNDLARIDRVLGRERKT